MLQVRTGVAALLAVAMLGALGCDDDDDDGTNPDPENFTASLTGAAERPDPVTTNATGTGTLSFTGNGPITFSINVTNLGSLPSMAHIHGPASVSEAAQIIVTFTPIAAVTSGALVSGTFSTTGHATISMDSLKVLLRNGNAYFNVHTANFPAGEIRGQILQQN